MNGSQNNEPLEAIDEIEEPIIMTENEKTLIKRKLFNLYDPLVCDYDSRYQEIEDYLEDSKRGKMDTNAFTKLYKRHGKWKIYLTIKGTHILVFNIYLTIKRTYTGWQP